MDKLTEMMDKMSANGYRSFYPEHYKPMSLGVYVLGCGYIYHYRSLPMTMVSRRTSDFYQLVYLVQGEGFFESRSFHRKDIQAGHAFILFPGEWHYYRPAVEENWKEYWIIFTGGIIQSLRQQKLLNPEEPLFFVGKDRILSGLFKECLAQGKQQTEAGREKSGICLLQILSRVLMNRTKSPEQFGDQMVTDVMNRIRSNPAGVWDFKNLAEKAGISYSWLRQRFYKVNGIPLGQYLNRERIWFACDLLAKGKSIKEVCWEVGMEDQYYFSRLFKKIMGTSPLQFERRHLKST